MVISSPGKGLATNRVTIYRRLSLFARPFASLKLAGCAGDDMEKRPYALKSVLWRNYAKVFFPGFGDLLADSLQSSIQYATENVSSPVTRYSYIS